MSNQNSALSSSATSERGRYFRLFSKMFLFLLGVVFLASGLASYITGATLFVDGGQMASKFGTWTEETAEFRDGRWRLR